MLTPGTKAARGAGLAVLGRNAVWMGGCRTVKPALEDGAGERCSALPWADRRRHLPPLLMRTSLFVSAVAVDWMTQ